MLNTLHRFSMDKFGELACIVGSHSMANICICRRKTIEFFARIKNTLYLCLLVCGCFISTPAYSANTFLDSLIPGFSFGVNYGDAYIDANDRNQYNRASALHFTASGFVEKPVSKLFRLSAEVHLSSLVEINSTDSSATGAFLAIGGKVGRFNNPTPSFIALSIGYSHIDVSNSGVRPDPNNYESCVAICFDFGPGPFRNGGHAKGLGYRVAVGKVLSERLRLELAYMNKGGKANGLPEGSIGSMETMSLSAHVFF